MSASAGGQLQSQSPPGDCEAMLEDLANEVLKVKHIAEEHPKRSLIKEHEELQAKLDELIEELRLQKAKILLASKTSTLIESNMRILSNCVEGIRSYYSELNNSTVIFLTKGKLRRKASVLTQSLRAKSNQLLTSVSLELLSTSPSAPVQEEVVPADSDLPLFYKFYYGVEKPVNYLKAYSTALAAASEDGSPKAMVIVATCLTLGRGVEKDLVKAREWFQKAASAGSLEGKCGLAESFLNSISDRKSSGMRVLKIVMASQGPDQSVDDAESIASTDEIKPTAQSALIEFTGKLKGRDAEDDELMRKAINLLLEVSVEFVSKAQRLLGVIAEEAQDFGNAIHWYSLAAKSDCPDAMNRLGLMYYYGRGVDVDHHTAYSLFSTAAEAGYRDALNNLGICLEKGQGVRENADDAVYFYRQGAEQGCVDSMYSLGYLLIRRYISMSSSPRTAFPTGRGLRYDEQQGWDDDKSEITLLQAQVPKFRSSLARQEIDLLATEGIKWLRYASDGGMVEASYQLGRVYEQGIGLNPDPNAAFLHYELAASRGHPKAAEKAGDMAYVGLGTAENRLIASQFYLIASKAGLTKSMNSLAVLLENGSADESGQPSQEEAAKWFWEASLAGYFPSVINLIDLLSLGVLRQFKSVSGDVVAVSRVRKWLEEDVVVPEDGNDKFEKAMQMLRDGVSAKSKRASQGSSMQNQRGRVDRSLSSSRSVQPQPLRRGLSQDYSRLGRYTTDSEMDDVSVDENTMRAAIERSGQVGPRLSLRTNELLQRSNSAESRYHTARTSIPGAPPAY